MSISIEILGHTVVRKMAYIMVNGQRTNAFVYELPYKLAGNQLLPVALKKDAGEVQVVVVFGKE